MEAKEQLERTRCKIYRRPERPIPWTLNQRDLPWNDPDFSRRMLLEHLDESHGAASRQPAERTHQVDWLWKKLGLRPGGRLCDQT